jgi:hypothetical protein
MLLTKKTVTFNPKTGYLLLDTDVFLYATDGDGDEDKDTPPYYNSETDKDQDGRPIKRFNLYNGPIRFFRSLVELNDHLGGLDINNDNSKQRLLIYKGHLFAGKKFPLEPKEGYDKFFVIEKIDDSVCFAEEVDSLKEIANSIEGDVALLTGESEKDLLSNYVVFAGTKKRPVYRCIDSELED